MQKRQSATQLLKTIVILIETWFLAEERESVEAMKNPTGWDENLSSDDFLFPD